MRPRRKSRQKKLQSDLPWTRRGEHFKRPMIDIHYPMYAIGAMQENLPMTKALDETLLKSYRRAGEEVGYWAERFRQSIERNGGRATVKRMLKQNGAANRKGFDALLEANRIDLSVEHLVCSSRFRQLFTKAELAVAAERLKEARKNAARRARKRERLFPDELEAGRTYSEGARKTVRVNRFEREPAARKACVNLHGLDCVVCGFNFERRYGKIGAGFIHVHHLKPVALSRGTYVVDPKHDLRPVCPNCHAMLHRPRKLMAIEKLRGRLQKTEPGTLPKTRKKRA